MGLVKENNYSNVDTNILEMQETLDAAYIGKHQVSLTEMTTTTVPAIAAGSLIEVNGSLLRSTTETAISTTDPVTSSTVADGTVYIMIDGTTLLPYFTATAPTWSDSKQGWYGTGGQANFRYLSFYMVKATAAYSQKAIIDGSFLPVAVQEKKFSYGVPAFSAVCDNSQTLGTNTIDLVNFDKELFDTAAAYDTGAKTYTIPVAGKYMISAWINVAANITGANVITLFLYKNGAQLKQTRYDSSATDLTRPGLHINTFDTFAKGDTLAVYARSLLASSVITIAGQPYEETAEFSGFRVCE